MEFVVLALIGIVVLGPDRLPQFARDAARMIRTLRDMATGARQQLREELGPEFADLDLRNLDPRTAVQRAVFGDDLPDLRKYSPGSFMRDTVFGEDEAQEDPDAPVSMTKDRPVRMDKPAPNGTSVNGSSAHGGSVHGGSVNSRSVNGGSVNGGSVNGGSAHGSSANGRAPGSRPRPRPRPRTNFDEDAT
jgi:sec-independent protein translocase protein TatB